MEDTHPEKNMTQKDSIQNTKGKTPVFLFILDYPFLG